MPIVISVSFFSNMPRQTYLTQPGCLSGSSGSIAPFSEPRYFLLR